MGCTCCGGPKNEVKPEAKQQPQPQPQPQPQQQQQQPASKSQNALLAANGVDNVQKLIDKCSSVKEVTDALRKAGLDGCSLIFGIDYTESNDKQGKRTFGGKPLHTVDGKALNPYQQVITYLGDTLESLDKDGLIPVFGFGDAKTKGTDVFPLNASGDCRGCKEVLATYAAVTPTVDLSGPTNFAPLIRKAIDIVKKTKAYSILVIIADGQVTSEKDTIDAIVAASAYPLSIVMVGVGDGPWDDMQKFDERIPRRQFDNFQFVNFFTAVASQNPHSAFALKALFEVPDQIKRIRDLNLYANCK